MKLLDNRRKTNMIYGYIRVSNDKKTEERQRIEINGFPARVEESKQ